ncbi:hypothetical protein [Spiroplasma endosymbiont of Nebria brevicollis]|uniref:hypothetical protein n=1 Tax=Spiroplasma endosymbiont of Nebria brevicollis TaxID=3066284 RepID=UPI00313B393B
MPTNKFKILGLMYIVIINYFAIFNSISKLLFILDFILTIIKKLVNIIIIKVKIGVIIISKISPICNCNNKWWLEIWIVQSPEILLENLQLFTNIEFKL